MSMKYALYIALASGAMTLAAAAQDGHTRQLNLRPEVRQNQLTPCQRFTYALGGVFFCGAGAAPALIALRGGPSDKRSPDGPPYAESIAGIVMGGVIGYHLLAKAWTGREEL